MNIIEATKLAIQLNTGIYRLSETSEASITIIVPNDSPLDYMLIDMPSKYLYNKPKRRKEWEEILIAYGWNPTISDILADDWKAVQSDEIRTIFGNGRLIEE